MQKINFFKVASLPATLIPDSFYFVLNGNYAESYLTDSSGSPKMIGNTVMINDLITSALATVNQVEYAADYAAMTAATYPSNVTVFVADASADPTVTAGSAYYFIEQSSGTITKISEFESLDLVLDWANIINKPVSTVAQIDQAVTDSHTHANKTELDKIGEDANGCLTYDGNPVVNWENAAW